MAAMRSSSMFDWRGRCMASEVAFMGMKVNAHCKGTLFFFVRCCRVGGKSPGSPDRGNRDSRDPFQCFSACTA